MTRTDLYLLLGRQPCPILRLHLMGGAFFDIRDPNATVVTHTTIEVLLPRDGSNQREAVINLSQVLWVEAITPVE